MTPRITELTDQFIADLRLLEGSRADYHDSLEYVLTRIKEEEAEQGTAVIEDCWYPDRRKK